MFNKYDRKRIHMHNNGFCNIFKKITVGMLLAALTLSLCACKIKGKSALIKYGRETYGDCEYIRQENKGSGNDASRTVYLRDKETGIEYEVTSKMYNVNIDGSSFGYSESTTSNFDGLYVEYLVKHAVDEIDALKDKYHFTFDFMYGIFNINFIDRSSSNNAKVVVTEFDQLLAKYDSRNLRPVSYLVYVNSTVYIGAYDASTHTYTGSYEFDIIDYVHDHYDAEAEFLDSIGAYIDQFLSYEDVDRLFPDRDGMPDGTAYYFKDKDGDIFVAIDLDEFGANQAGILLFRDKSSGMERIDY